MNDAQRTYLKNRLLDWSFVRALPLAKKREKDWDDLVLLHLHNFAVRAWRRPLHDEEKLQLTKIYNDSIAKELDRESAAREVLVRVLVAPAFLYKIEEGSEPGTHPVQPWELASRLSYFLWSSLPDQELSEKASSNTLSKPEILLSEVHRMLGN